MEQRSKEWFEMRCGCITASRFADVMTEPQSKADREAGKLSKSAETYLLEKVGECLTGFAVQGNPTPTQQWGIDWEPHAKRVYSELTGYDVAEPGFCVHPMFDKVGCSPDGLIEAAGGLEIKCPATTKEHVRVLTAQGVPSQYKAQVQGSMWVTQREWWDFVSYDPRIDTEAALVKVRCNRDEDYIAKLERACLRFLERMEEVLSVVTSEEMKCEAHRMAQLVCPPVELIYQGEVISL